MGDVRSSLSVGRATLSERIDAALAKELEHVNHDLAARVSEKVKNELTNAFRTMEFQTASIQRLSDADFCQDKRSSNPKSMVAPGVPRFLRWISDNGHKYDFLSVKFLREKVFAADPAAQEALQFSIDEKILETYDVPNPKNPSRPVTACRINRDHPLIREVLSDIKAQ